MKEDEILEIFERFPDIEERNRYLKAKRRMKQLKGFYIHLLIYIIVFSLHYIKQLSPYREDHVDQNLGAILWGIVILIHAASVFLPNFALGRDWEEKKIQELIDKEKNQR